MWDNLWVYLVIATLNTVLIFFSSNKFFLAMQQVGYKGYRYFKWLHGKKNQYLNRLMLLSLLGFLFFMAFGITFAPLVGRRVAPYMGFIAYLFFAFVYINAEHHVNVKIKLKVTRRMVRLMITFILVTFIATLLVVLLCNVVNHFWLTGLNKDVFSVLKYAFITLTPFLAPFIVIIAYSINKPFEDANNRRYVRRTKKVLDSSNIIKIGITGSYGKTSVKELLSTVLSVKYRVLATPESYNTPLGISFTVKQLDATHDIFIAEMGARQVGDISDLAELVNPDIAILTGVTGQHLESFGNLENVKKTKFELFEKLKTGGRAFFSLNGENAQELADKFNGEKYLTGKENCYAYAKDIKTTANGSTFTLCLDGEKEIKCSTSLIGEHSVSNIVLVSAVAHNLGMSVEEISLGINRLHAIKHRLEVVKGQKGITVIDDSYNANSVGADCALKALNEFEGRKIIVTPGLVELGADQKRLNYEFGKKIAKTCDIMIISAKHNAEMLIHGFTDAGKEKENIHYAKNLVKAKEVLSSIVTEGDIVLFENDLPDIYD